MFWVKRNKLRALLALGGLGLLSAVVAQRRHTAVPPSSRPAVVTSIEPRPSLFMSLYSRLAEQIDHKVGWDHLPPFLGLSVIFGLRETLRQRNLYDTNVIPAANLPTIAPFDPCFLSMRTFDGTYNDLHEPRMGMARSRFGRNIPIELTRPETEPAILSPNPRTISRELLTRETFQPASTLNILAAAWIQFMIRDWINHGSGDKNHYWTIPLSPDDPWRKIQDPMRIVRTPSDPTRGPQSESFPPTHINMETHWWDASQIYGSNAEVQNRVRSGQGGELRIGENGLLAFPDDPKLNLRMIPGWWIGLEIMQTLFVREHNAICKHLQAEYPSWSDDEIFARARLINAALLAKIHTVEWTPAIISHPTSQLALRANWWGLEMERLNKAFGRIGGDIIGGIPGSETNHFGVPYALTEEFMSVYRMHPLLPDDFRFRSSETGKLISGGTLTLDKVTGPQAYQLVQRISLSDLIYSLGTSNPGAIVLHNYPKFLQNFTRPDKVLVDLAAIDIMRIREMGVPRYNEFRQLFHLPPARTFEEITDHPEWAEEMRQVYHNEVDRVDLMIGMFAERRPQGFAFSDTAFRVFILMASRRLNSDRFFTRDFTPQVYTPVGMDWIKNNSMVTVLLRHFPQLHSSLRSSQNAFVPWMDLDVC